MISFAQVYTAQWSDTIPSWNVWFQVVIDLTLFYFNTPTKPNYNSPILDLNCFTFMTGKDLVNRSAGLSTPAIWNGSMTLFSYCSWLQWCQMSMCLVWYSTAGFTMRNIAAWLSEPSGIGPSMGNPISPLKDLSHAACHLMLASSIYSASPTDNVTVFCRWDAQDIAPFSIRYTCPDVEWQSSLFSPQSESEYPINLASELPSYLILSSFVPLR